MRIAAILVFCSCAIAQDVLPPGKAIMLEISSGATREYAVQLRPDDYVDVSITRHGKTDVAVFRPNRPNGVLLRRFAAPAMDGKRQMAFVAEIEGRYKIELTNQSRQPATCQILVNEIVPIVERLRAPSWNDRYPSPRMAALQEQIVSGRTNTDDFWNRVAREGMPLVESLGSDGKYQLVTFLWRGTPSTQNVLVIGSFSGSTSYLDDVMHRIAESPITDFVDWYCSEPRLAFNRTVVPHRPPIGPAMQIRRQFVGRLPVSRCVYAAKTDVELLFGPRHNHTSDHLRTRNRFSQPPPSCQPKPL